VSRFASGALDLQPGYTSSIMTGLIETPLFLDFEASSLSDTSYPIGVAWSNPDGSIEPHLISPAGIEKWTNWDPAAEQVHGIARSELLALGAAPRILCDRIRHCLSSKTVHRWSEVQGRPTIPN
jgi:hypothetical protein